MQRSRTDPFVIKPYLLAKSVLFLPILANPPPHWGLGIVGLIFVILVGLGFWQLFRHRLSNAYLDANKIPRSTRRTLIGVWIFAIFCAILGIVLDFGKRELGWGRDDDPPAAVRSP